MAIAAARFLRPNCSQSLVLLGLVVCLLLWSSVVRGDDPDPLLNVSIADLGQNTGVWQTGTEDGDWAAESDPSRMGIARTTARPSSTESSWAVNYIRPAYEKPMLPTTVYYHFNIEEAEYSVNCETKSILTVNGQFPGPTINANEGDRVVVNVTNSTPTNMTIHFHGIRQAKSPWMDGVAYITMCPIQSGDYFVHNFTISNQRGTLMWHAHIGWHRATIYGAFLMQPTTDWKELEFPGPNPIPVAGTPDDGRYPYPEPDGEFPVILGEWWNKDIAQVEMDGLQAGGAFQVSDAMTINGLPGLMYNCSTPENTPPGKKTEGFSSFNVEQGKTYLLRIINAALNTHLFFSLANHSLTVVEADGEYVQAYNTTIIFLSPGQTFGVLLKANQTKGTYSMAASGYGRFEEPAGGILKPTALVVYGKDSPDLNQDFTATRPYLPTFDDHECANEFTKAMHTLYPGRVPLTVDREIFMTAGLSRRPCDAYPTARCTDERVADGLRAQAELNNITFEQPWISLLEASHFNIPGVFTEDFPDQPEHKYNWTVDHEPPPVETVSNYGTKVIGVEFNSTVQIVLQNTVIRGFENHPFHLHGQNFYELGNGDGNYDGETAKLNLHNPALRNTVAVPYAGWAVIRFKANNPGMWLFHCHLEKHASWGMMAVFLVHNSQGEGRCGGPNSYDCPPERLLPC